MLSNHVREGGVPEGGRGDAPDPSVRIVLESHICSSLLVIAYIRLSPRIIEVYLGDKVSCS